MPERHGLMIDLETEGLSTDAAVWQICVMTFDLDSGGIIDEITRYICPAIQIKEFGSSYDKGIKEWREKNGTAEIYNNARHATGHGSREANITRFNDTLFSIYGYIKKYCKTTPEKSQEIWCSGANFDFPVLSNLLEQWAAMWMRETGQDNKWLRELASGRMPWYYSATRCLRTARALVGNSDKSLTPQPGGMKEHDANWDCVWQVQQYKHVMGTFESWRNSSGL